MRSVITRDQLFVGAVVLHDGTEKFAAVVQSLRQDQINLLDIYGFCENTTTISQLRPCKISHYALRRLGFEETELMSTCYVFSIPDSGSQFTIRRKGHTWHLQLDASSIYVNSVHQLQLVVWSLTGFMLTTVPIEVEEYDLAE